MSDRPTPETDNDTQFELAAWELLKETRELARELLDALENCREDSVEYWKRGGGTRNCAQYEELEGRVSIADSVIAKAKEVLP
jgi:hypothetical protein